MPNYITSVLTITGPSADVSALVAKCWKQCERNPFLDFETIIPMPQSVINTIRPSGFGDEKVPDGLPAGSDRCGDAHVELRAKCMIEGGYGYHNCLFPWIPADVRKWTELADWLDKETPAARFWAQRVLIAAGETGSSGWYEWSIANWGTKWNSYSGVLREQSEGRAVLAFETAWSVPVPVLRKLSADFPALSIACESIDEGGGAYAGTFAAGTGDVERVEEDDAITMRVYGRAKHTDEDSTP